MNVTCQITEQTYKLKKLVNRRQITNWNPETQPRPIPLGAKYEKTVFLGADSISIYQTPAGVWYGVKEGRAE